MLIRKGEKYTVDQILPAIGVESRVDLAGDVVKTNSLRLLNFKAHGIKCVSCGLEGSYFVKEKHTKADHVYHLNLYGLDKNGKEVLLTKDHITPLSKGGRDYIDNMQTMCSTCNEEKGSTLAKEYREKSIRKNLKLGFLKIFPTIACIILGIIFLCCGLYMTGTIFMFLGAYPIASYFARLLYSSMDNFQKIR